MYSPTITTFANLAPPWNLATLDANFAALAAQMANAASWAAAGGTADVITATYSPVNLALTDGLLLGFRASAANATTTPTFSPDGLAAHTITKKGGAALATGDIFGSLAECLIRYNLANTRWELLNPAAAVSSFLAKSGTVASCPADTTEDTLATIAVGANTLGTNGWMRITTNWSFTNNGNNKTLRVRYSGAAGTQYLGTTLTTQQYTMVQTIIANAGATNSQRGNSQTITFAGVTGTTAATAQTSAVDTTASTTIVITGQKGSAGDALTLESYLVEVFP